MQQQARVVECSSRTSLYMCCAPFGTQVQSGAGRTGTWLGHYRIFVFVFETARSGGGSLLVVCYVSTQMCVQQCTPTTLPYIPVSIYHTVSIRCAPFGLTQVQSGAGRTGTWWGHQQFDAGAAQPDMIVFAKGIASGYPLAGVAARDDLFTKLVPGSVVREW